MTKKLAAFLFLSFPCVVLLQFGLLPRLKLGNFGPDIFLLWAFFLAVNAPGLRASASCFLIGLSVDLLCSPRLGFAAMGYLLMARLWLFISRRLPLRSSLTRSITAGLFAGLMHLYLLLPGIVLRGEIPAVSEFFFAAPIAAASALAWFPVSWWFARLGEITHLLQRGKSSLPDEKKFSPGILNLESLERRAVG